MTDSGVLPLRLTNTGSAAWPAGQQLVVGWTVSDAPYLARPPGELRPADVAVPALGPGESVELAVPIAAPAQGRSLLWVSLSGPAGDLTELGSPALQLAWAP